MIAPMAPITPAARRILLVEDEPSLVLTLSDRLLSEGYQVETAGDGEEGLRVAREYQGTLALLISDVVMPHLGGRALAEQLRSIRPACRVLFLSGYARDAVNRRGGLDSQHAFLQKPFTSLALARKVRSVLQAPMPARKL